MFSVLQEFVKAVMGNSMLLMVVVAAPVAAGAVVFYLLAREPSRPRLGGWIGRATRRGHHRGHRIVVRKGGPDAAAAPIADPIAQPGDVGPVVSAPIGHVIFVDPFQDEDAEEVYDLDEIDVDLEAEDDLDSYSN